jgi:hypothetical protein
LVVVLATLASHSPMVVVLPTIASYSLLACCSTYNS